MENVGKCKGRFDHNNNNDNNHKNWVEYITKLIENSCKNEILCNWTVIFNTHILCMCAKSFFL